MGMDMGIKEREGENPEELSFIRNIVSTDEGGSGSGVACRLTGGDNSSSTPCVFVVHQQVCTYCIFCQS